MVAMEERRRSIILLLGLYMSVYMLVKHVMYIQALFLQEVWEKFAILSLVNECMGHTDRTDVKSHSPLVVGTWTQKELRKRIQVKYIIFIFLCETLGPYLKKENIRSRIIVPVQNK